MQSFGPSVVESERSAIPTRRRPRIRPPRVRFGAFNPVPLPGENPNDATRSASATSASAIRRSPHPEVAAGDHFDAHASTSAWMTLGWVGLRRGPTVRRLTCSHRSSRPLSVPLQETARRCRIHRTTGMFSRWESQHSPRKTAPTPDVSRVKSTMAMTMNTRAATAAIVTGDVTLRVIGRVLGDRTSLTRSGSPFMRPSPHAGLLRHGG